MDKLRRACRILVVDDEEVVREVIRTALERPDWYLVEAADGEEAIELLLLEPFDLLIADKNMPGITGLDVIRRAKAIDPHMSTMMVTAFASRESAEEAMAIGLDDYLTKPFELDDLIAKVEQAISNRWERTGVHPRPKAREPRRHVLVCDPSRQTSGLLADGLGLLGHRARMVDGLGKVIEALRQKSCDALVCDLDMLNRDDASACFLRSALLMAPDVSFVAVAAQRGLHDAIGAVRRGAGKVIYHPLESATEVADQLRDFLGQAG